jgi:hypothetical protein
MPEKKPRETLTQSAVRMYADDRSAMQELGRKRGIPYSKIVRAGWHLVQKAVGLPEGHTLAVVNNEAKVVEFVQLDL